MNRLEAPPSGNWRVHAPLVTCLVLVLLLALVVFRYFVLTFTVAGSVALMLGPLHRVLTARLKGRRALAAGLLTALCAVVILVPVLSYGTLIFQQAFAFFEWLRPRLTPQALEELWTRTLPARYPLLMSLVREYGGGGSSMATASGALSRLVSAANDFVGVAVTQIAALLVDLVLFLMMVFFLLRDGEDLREALRGISPLTRGQETEMLEHLTNTVKGVLQSIVVVPVIQGLVAFVGFWVLGVPSPLLWSVMVVFAAMIPILGSPLAWVPAAVYLLVTGATGRGLGLVAYGVLVISMVDNIVKPIILRGAARIHTMLGFLSILGGIYAFGPKGIVAGPVVLSLVLSAYRIYRYDVLRWRQAPEAGASSGPATGMEVAAPPRPESEAALTSSR